MSDKIRLTISDEVARAIDNARGLYSRQEYILIALVERLQAAERPPEPERTPVKPAAETELDF